MNIFAGSKICRKQTGPFHWFLADLKWCGVGYLRVQAHSGWCTARTRVRPPPAGAQPRHYSPHYSPGRGSRSPRRVIAAHHANTPDNKMTSQFFTAKRLLVSGRSSISYPNNRPSQLWNKKIYIICVCGKHSPGRGSRSPLQEIAAHHTTKMRQQMTSQFYTGWDVLVG